MLQQKLTHFLNSRPAGFSADELLVVAVSGGPDSLALLHCLSSLHPRTKLLVAHLDHELRPGSAEEAAWVAAKAAEWDLACRLGRQDVAALAAREALSIEEAARQARYRFLAETARQAGCRFVASGHTADDQAETVLMHFLRGSGLAGLRGMQPHSSLPEAADLFLLRPLLTVDRAEVEAYCREHNLQPLEDESNRDTRFFRNRLRHRLLPLLEDYNPQIKSRLQHMARTVSDDYAWLQQELDRRWPDIVRHEDEQQLVFHKEMWQALPPALQRYALRRALERLHPALRDLGYRAVEQARRVAVQGQVGQRSALPAGFWLQVGYRQLTLYHETRPPRPDLPQLPGDEPLAVPVPGRLELGGWVLESDLLEQVSLAQVRQNPDPWQVHLPVTLAQGLALRPRRPGERMEPLGMDGRSVSLKELMINRKIPAEMRSRWPLLVHHEQPVWLAGHTLDRRARLITESGPALRLQIRPA